ncbi:MAG: glycerol-3-phosphate 1-O-acyltransferase PlsY [Bacteroidota bacterium]
MFMILIVLGFISAYLLGSVPTAVWFGKLYHGIDVREHGSGNPGATNTFRVLGKRAGFIVLLIDVLKGLFAASIATLLMKGGFISSNNLVTFKLLYGIMAVTGHIFSAFINFKGGKGVATLLGMMIAIHYEAALVCIALFLVILITSKYVSLGSILSALAFPIMLTFIPRFQTSEPLLIIFGFFLFIVVVWTHHKNIKRLLEGKENKTYILKSKK